MPLPAVLQARLAKRGILNDKNKPTENSEQNEPNNENNKEDEEVIAEDYDETEGQIPKALSDKLGVQSTESKEQAAYSIKGYPGCPNKYNIWHECSTFCRDNWIPGKKKPAKRYCQIRKKILALYPLPANWTEVYDPGTARHYYWNEENDRVSWLPPNHPRAVITDSAAKLRYRRLLNKSNGTEREKKDSDSESSSSSNRGESSSSDKDTDDDDKDRRRKLNRFQVTNRMQNRRRVVKANDLDPMDPSSYSDIPRGGWSDGLNKGLEAKTGADTTASGPLYQMRPYPSPGAVLRANASKKP